MTESATLKIARYISERRFPDQPPHAVAAAKTAILDTVGVAVAAATEPKSRPALEYVASLGATPTCTIIGSDVLSSPESASFANGILSHILDFDDRWHSSTHCLPPALALGEANNANGQQLINAYLVGREVRLHLDLELRRGREGEVDPRKGRGPGWRGWHETGVSGSLAAAATGANMLGLDTHTTRMALGIASSLASGLIANFGTGTKSLHAGNAARNGIVASQLASAGVSAEPDILTARRGFLEAISYPDERDMDSVAASLWAFSHTGENGVRIKPFPACTGVGVFIEMARELHRQHTIPPDDIESIVIRRVAGQTTKRDFPADHLEAKFSPAFVTIACLLDGTLSLENCNMPFLTSDRVQQLLDSARYEEADEFGLRVTLRSGQTLDQGPVPLTDLTGPDQISEKFRSCVEPILGSAAAAEIEQIIAELEQLESVKDLTRLLRPSARN